MGCSRCLLGAGARVAALRRRPSPRLSGFDADIDAETGLRPGCRSGEDLGSGPRADPSVRRTRSPSRAPRSSRCGRRAVGEAREAVDDLRGHRVLRRYAERVAAESALRGARASAALEGADLAVCDVAAVATVVDAGWQVLPASRERPIVQGALRVAAEIGLLRDDLAAGTAAGAGAAAHTGRRRPAGRSRWAGRAPGRRPGSPGGLGHCCTLTDRAPALVVAAVVHGELLAMGAFAGRQPASSAAARRRLTWWPAAWTRGACRCPRWATSSSAATAYLDALDGYRQGGAEGIAAWVVHCAEAVVLGAREGVAVCESIQRGA